MGRAEQSEYSRGVEALTIRGEAELATFGLDWHICNERRKSRRTGVRKPVGILVALRAALVATGFAKLLQVLRREREAAAGRPLSNSERLDHRGVAAILLAFELLMGYFVAPELHAAKWLVASLLYTAILAMVAGLGLSATAGVTGGLQPGTGQPEAGAPKVARNEPCPCGSGKKFKHCHGARPGTASHQ
jgi:hypothetical protein